MREHLLQRQWEGLNGVKNKTFRERTKQIYLIPMPKELNLTPSKIVIISAPQKNSTNKATTHHQKWQ